MAVTQRGESDDKHGGFHGTPDTGRDLPLVTTAPPFTDLNHHFQFKTISQPDPHYQSQGISKDSGEMDHHLFKALSAQLVPHEDAAAFSDMATGSFFAHDAKLTAESLKQSEAASFEELSTESLTTSIVPSSDPPPCNTAPGEQLGSPHAATTQETKGVTTLLMRKEEEKSKTREKRKGPNIEASAVTVSGDQDDETTTTTIFTTTIITTIQTPGNTTALRSHSKMLLTCYSRTCP